MEFSDVIKRRKMIREFTGEPLEPGTAERLLRAANRAPSAGFTQGYSFLVLDGAEQAAPLWECFLADASSAGDREAAERAEVAALSKAPLVIVPLANKDSYLDRYAQPDKGWTDRGESRWPVPYWYVDTGFAALLILLDVVDQRLGAVLFGIQPSIMDAFRARFSVPADWTPIGAIAIGHPAPGAGAEGSALRKERKSLDELVHNGRW